MDVPWGSPTNSSKAHPLDESHATANTDAAASPAQPAKDIQPHQPSGSVTPPPRVNASQEEHRAAAAPLASPAKPSPPEEGSRYLKWILKDLSYWKQRGGITLQLVDAADQAFANVSRRVAVATIQPMCQL